MAVGWRSYADDPAWIHPVVGVERPFDRLHQSKCHGRFVVRQGVHLEAAHAVFGGDRTIESMHLVLHERVDAFFFALQKLGAVVVCGGLHVVVQIAIAQMPKIHQPHTRHLARETRIGLSAESGNA